MRRTTAPTIAATLSTGLVLDVKQASVTLDDSWAPYGQLTLTCAAVDGPTLDTIEPRSGQRATVLLNDHADLFGNPATSRTLDLYLQARSQDWAAGELTVTLTTDESLLIDAGLLLRNTKDWGATSAKVLVNKILALFGKSLAAGAADMTIAAAAAVQSPGQSYWDFLDGTLQGGNLRLWCDESRAWHLTDKEQVAAGQLRLSYLETVTGLTDTIDLSTDSWYDSVVIRYSYPDSNGYVQTSYDYSGPASPKRTVRIDFGTPPAVDGAARRLLKRVQGRGRVLEHEATLRLDATPTQAFLASLPDGSPDQSGLLSAVTWTLPAGLMQVRTRELSDTIGTMWAAQLSGVSWASIGAGVQWLQYLAIAWTRPAAGEAWASESAGVRWSEYGS